MLNKLNKKEKFDHLSFESNEGGRSFLFNNKGGIRSPSLDFLDTSSENVSEDLILEYLAQIISEMYLKEVHGIDPATKEESSDLLSSLN